jgi:O-acetyl-ADP-ribose deacetylase (regulator of RNase III)
MSPSLVPLDGDRALAATVGDITRVAADAIVNAANESLAGGGGVDGAIHRAGGPAIMADLEARYGRARRCPTGSAVISAAGNLPATWVVHAVGPVWHGGAAGEAALLASAYRSAFALADDAGARSVTFPAISTGVYRYPVEEAAAIAVTAVTDALASAVSVRLATFVLFSEASFAAFEAALRRIGPTTV